MTREHSDPDSSGPKFRRRMVDDELGITGMIRGGCVSGLKSHSTMRKRSRLRGMLFVFTSRDPYSDMGVDLMTTTWSKPLVAGVLGLGCYIPCS